ncbi:MAG: hypothetical protein ABI467_20500 [Kofleriaceae bacterium]
MPHEPHNSTRAVSTLCAGGEWAAAHGDFAGLRDVARRLQRYVPEAVDELHALEAACRNDIDRASELWVQVQRRIATAARA